LPKVDSNAAATTGDKSLKRRRSNLLFLHEWPFRYRLKEMMMLILTQKCYS
jgi:hypothetical protein